jgi:hypothetical protein
MSIRIYIFMIIWRKNARRSVHAKLYMHAYSRFLRVDARTHARIHTHARTNTRIHTLSWRCTGAVVPQPLRERAPWLCQTCLAEILESHCPSASSMYQGTTESAFENVCPF